MVGYGERLSARTRRAALVGVVVMALVSLAIYQSTLVAHVALYGVQTAEVTVQDVHVEDDRFVVRLGVENPTNREVTVDGAQVYARVDGAIVNSVPETRVETTTIPPESVATVTVRLPVRSDQRDTVAAWTNGTGTLSLSGDLRMVVADRQARVRFEWRA